MINFVFIGFKSLQGFPVKIPMSRWIVAANEDVMYSKPKKF